ncbi:FxsA family protein [Sulfurimonas lithotrophica]|uniref:FxsA family protein n=1 Tax=Sulfurimonas lithotrophica TaxID=2590022 RepID=A0A5P8P043_9BACT|nr:FxsA family protein [Sulfurimonas lithotrophica]QFR49073.1 FxsA family protein [Sulfurimonas lithotrophica]
MIYFIVYLFLEVLLSVNISSYIGGLWTFFEILLSAFIGIYILVNFKESLRENLTAVSYNCIDLQEFQSLNLFTLIGAVFLIIPGFLTDILGVLMQFSVFTTMFVNRYQMHKTNSCRKEDQEFNSYNSHITKESDVIDVEIISDNSTK